MSFSIVEEAWDLVRAAAAAGVAVVEGNFASGAECGDKRMKSGKTSRIVIPLEYSPLVIVYPPLKVMICVGFYLVLTGGTTFRLFLRKFIINEL